MPCMCGAPDCPRCYPQNFQNIGGRRVYTGEMDDEEIERMKDQAAEAAWDNMHDTN